LRGSLSIMSKKAFMPTEALHCNDTKQNEKWLFKNDTEQGHFPNSKVSIKIRKFGIEQWVWRCHGDGHFETRQVDDVTHVCV
jgi:hypothetical protein